MGSEDGKLDAFGYDYSSQMTAASYGWNWNGSQWVNPIRSANYTLDLVGNRNQVNDSAIGTWNYAPNNLNQYTSAGPNTVVNGSEHEIAGYQGISYSYINDGRLTSVSGNGNNYNIKYDALGRTISRTLNGATTYYYYDGEWSELGSRDMDGFAGMGNLRSERERMSQKPILEQGATSATNIYGLGVDENVIRFEPANVYYFYQDHEGSVTHVANLSGGVVEQYRYDAFGQPTIMDGWGNVRGSSAINNRFMFTGREWSELGSRDIDGCAGMGNLRNEREGMSQWAPVNLGFYEYRARAYHPGLGRFMSEDPKGFDAGDYNLFRYCGNDPEDKTDPMGLAAGIFSPSGDWARIANNGENIGGDSGGGSSGGGGSSPKAEQAGGGTDAGAAETYTVIFPGLGPGQKPTSGETHWSNQEFSKNATATNPTNSHVFGRNHVKEAFNAAVDAHAHGQKIDIYGYSRGAKAAVNLSQRLNAAHISVHKLVTVDPVRVLVWGDRPINFMVPSNVQRAENYYHPANHPRQGIFDFQERR